MTKGNGYKKIAIRLKKTVRSSIEKLKKFKTIMNHPERDHTAILSAARVKRMVREVKQSLKIQNYRVWQHLGVTMSPNPPKDVTAVPTNCLEGMPERGFSYLFITSTSTWGLPGATETLTSAVVRRNQNVAL